MRSNDDDCEGKFDDEGEDRKMDESVDCRSGFTSPINQNKVIGRCKFRSTRGTFWMTKTLSCFIRGCRKDELWS